MTYERAGLGVSTLLLVGSLGCEGRTTKVYLHGNGRPPYVFITARAHHVLVDRSKQLCKRFDLDSDNPCYGEGVYSCSLRFEDAVLRTIHERLGDGVRVDSSIMEDVLWDSFPILLTIPRDSC